MIIDNLIELNTINKSELNAEQSHVLKDKSFVGKAGIKEQGTMPDNGTVSKVLSAGESYTVPLGYHNGNGVVSAKTLAEQTTATASAAHILSPYTAWVTGGKITGTMVNRSGWSSSVAMNSSVVIPQGYHDGTKSVTGPVITNRGAWTSSVAMNSSVTVPQGYHNGSGKVNGPVITNRGTVNQSLNAGQSYSIQTGYYSGGTITANSLSSQTQGDAIAKDIKKGKIAWVNGSRIVGTASLAIPEADLAFLTSGNAAVSIWHVEEYGNIRTDNFKNEIFGFYVDSGSAGDADYGKSINRYYKVSLNLIDTANQKRVDWPSEEGYSYTIPLDVFIIQYKSYSYDYNVVLTNPYKSLRIANVQTVYSNTRKGDFNMVSYEEPFNPTNGFIQYAIKTGVQYGGFNLQINAGQFKVYFNNQLITQLKFIEHDIYNTVGTKSIGSNPIL